MKRIVCFIGIFYSVWGYSQYDTSIYLIHPAVGDSIDLTEKIKFHLFPFSSDKDFKYAQFLKVSDATFLLKIHKNDLKTVFLNYSLKDIGDIEHIIDIQLSKNKPPAKKRPELKDSKFTNLHIYTGVRTAVIPIENQIMEAYVNDCYVGTGWDGNFITFGGKPYVDRGLTNPFNIAMEVNLNRRFRIGFQTMPGFRVYVDAYKGYNQFHNIVIRQQLKNQTVMLNGSYVLLPYRNFREIGFEIACGGSLMLNRFVVYTTYGAIESDSIHSNHDSKEFWQYSNLIGGNLFTRINIYLGSYFSLTCQLNESYIPNFHVESKSLPLCYLDCNTPSYNLHLKSFSFSLGVSAHFFKSDKSILHLKSRKQD